MTVENHWIKGLFTAIDAKSAEDFAAFLSDDVTFCFGNNPAVEGKGAASEYVAGFFSAIESLSHELFDMSVDGDKLVCRGQVTYIRLDGSTLTVPFCNWFDIEGEKVRRYLIYVDASKLFEA